MKVIILGAGQVGYSIARYLSSEDNDITIVDQSSELLRKISDSIDIQPVLGFGSHPDVLEQAGASEADVIIAVTGSDEVNIVACQVAHTLFKVNTKIARIRNQSYLSPLWSELFNPHNLAIDVIISPEVEVARAISRSIQVMGAFDVIPLVGGRIKAIGIRCTSKSPIINTPLRLFPNLFPKLNIVVACVTRKDQTFIPTSDHQLLIDDEVYVVVDQDHINKVMETFGYFDPDGRRVIIMGAGGIGLNLAKEMEKDQPDVLTKVIEKDPQRAEYAARNLKQTEVLCGDALDPDVLSEANAQATETVVAVTEDDKVNIMSSLLAKRYGASRALTLLNNMTYSSLVTSLGIDAVVNPRAITVSTILQYIREGRIRSIHSLRDGHAEVIEAEAQETSNIIGLTVEEINIKKSIIVAALIRDDKVMIAPSKVLICTDDRLILVVAKDAVHKVEKLFAIRPTYL